MYPASYRAFASFSCRVRLPKPFAVALSPSYLLAMATAVAAVDVSRVWVSWGIEATTAREVGVGVAHKNGGG
jgi:hypothetical protein